MPHWMGEVAAYGSFAFLGQRYEITVTAVAGPFLAQSER